MEIPAERFKNDLYDAISEIRGNDVKHLKYGGPFGRNDGNLEEAC
jgi:hypothetical protein